LTRWALVTGAGGDLGRATCVSLARDGWSLLLAEHPTGAAALAATRAAVGGATTATALFDVTDPAAVAAAVGDLTDSHGPPAALVANAGVQGEFAPIHEHDADSFRRVLDVNVFGVFTVVRETARRMIAGGGRGAIVALASMAGVSGAPNMPAYAASKAAVIGLVKSASRDLAPHGIRVNSVAPGFIGPGAMWDNQVARQAAAGSQYFAADPDAVARQMVGLIPLRRVGTPDEVADVVCYLASERASYLTGINLEIAGGAQ
jgi:NAD(P)-dependent dehydrogenase (short-subunit alcohol dehydrogenase family)